MSILTWIFIIVAIFAESAKAVDFSEFGTMNFSSPSLQSTINSSFSASPGITFLGLGITLGFQVKEGLDVETGVIYITRAFRASSSGLWYDLATIQIPLIVRYWISDKLSFGLGPYFSHGFRNLTTTQGSNSNIIGYDQVLLKTDEFGLVASVRYRAQMTEMISFIADERFVYGLTNVDVSGNGSVYFRDFQTWIGIGFKL